MTHWTALLIIIVIITVNRNFCASKLEDDEEWTAMLCTPTLQNGCYGKCVCVMKFCNTNPLFSISEFFLIQVLKIYSRFLEGKSSVTKECTVVVFLSKQQTLLYQFPAILDVVRPFIYLFLLWLHKPKVQLMDSKLFKKKSLYVSCLRCRVQKCVLYHLVTQLHPARNSTG